jgi:hypothetical protein
MIMSISLSVPLEGE